MQINKLLQTVVNQNASDLILTVGCRPMIRLHGRLVPLQTKVLDGDDTVSLMRSITSERAQQELQEVGGSDFGFSFGEQARFRVSVFKQRGKTATQVGKYGLIHRSIGAAQHLGTHLDHHPLGISHMGSPDRVRHLRRHGARMIQRYLSTRSMRAPSARNLSSIRS